jgi:hypothetical protein
MKLPYIFIFDIDNTIIGNVSRCSIEYTILQFIAKYCKKDNILNDCVKNVDFVDELNDGLLRPNFKDFINFIKKKYKNVEIYVYTYSTYKWVHKGLISNIEKSCGFKFNEPYFTREDSTKNEKLLGNIFDIIITNLVIKYPALKLDKNKKIVFDSQLVFIDDIPNKLSDYPNKQIICPNYDYQPSYYDIQTKIITKYNINSNVFDNIELLNTLNNIIEYSDYPIYSKNGNIYQQNKELKYITEIKNIRKIEILNNAIKDTFFIDLMQILNKNNIHKFDDINSINKELSLYTQNTI